MKLCQHIGQPNGIRERALSVCIITSCSRDVTAPQAELNKR